MRLSAGLQWVALITIIPRNGTGRMGVMRTRIMLIFLVMLCFPAEAVEDKDKDDIYKVLSREELRSYCVYNNKIFSIGSFICVGKALPMECAGASGPPANLAWRRVNDDVARGACVDRAAP
jgi:hypothetical protein